MTGSRWVFRRVMFVAGSGVILADVTLMWILAPGGLDVLGVAWHAVVSPHEAFRDVLASGASAAVGWWFGLGYAVLYSGTAALLAGRGFRPVTEPVLPIRTDTYYAWQSLFTLPTAIAATGAGSLAAHGVARAFGSTAGLDEMWGVFMVAMVVPTFVSMWLPETIGPFVARPGATTDPYPERFNVVRVIAGSVWAAVLAVVAVAATGPGIVASIVAGVVGAGITGATFAVVLR